MVGLGGTHLTELASHDKKNCEQYNERIDLRAHKNTRQRGREPVREGAHDRAEGCSTHIEHSLTYNIYSLFIGFYGV